MTENNDRPTGPEAAYRTPRETEGLHDPLAAALDAAVPGWRLGPGPHLPLHSRRERLEVASELFRLLFKAADLGPADLAACGPLYAAAAVGAADDLLGELARPVLGRDARLERVEAAARDLRGRADADLVAALRRGGLRGADGDDGADLRDETDLVDVLNAAGVPMALDLPRYDALRCVQANPGWRLRERRAGGPAV